MAKKNDQSKNDPGYHFRDIIKLPDILTLANVLCGFLAIFFTIYRLYAVAMILLPLAFVFDLLDGYVARKIKRTGEFGMHLDSLSDIVSFGVAPVILGVMLLPFGLLTIFALTFFLLAGVLRLARYGIMKNKKLFLGVPISINGVLFPIIYFLDLESLLYIPLYILLGAIMISHLVIKRVKVKGIEI